MFVLNNYFITPEKIDFCIKRYMLYISTNLIIVQFHNDNCRFHCIYNQVVRDYQIV